MRLLWFVILLTGNVCVSRKFDWKFAVGVVRSYMCTGNMDWWKEIKKDPALKFVMHVAVITFFDHSKFFDIETLDEIVGEARFAVDEHSLEKRTKVSGCLWDGIRDWHFVPFLCPLPSEKFMEKYDDTLDMIYNFICLKQSRVSFDTGCKIGLAIFQERFAIRSAVKPYLCENPRVKRQFDANSLMAIFKQTACLQSTEFNFEYVAIERGNSLHFSTFGIWCCIIEFVKA